MNPERSTNNDREARPNGTDAGETMLSIEPVAITGETAEPINETNFVSIAELKGLEDLADAAGGEDFADVEDVMAIVDIADAADSIDAIHEAEAAAATDAETTVPQHAGNLQSTTTWKTYRYNGSEMLQQEDSIATEVPITIKIEGEEFATLVCTPTDVIDLVTGFLASEGLIRFADQIESLSLEMDRGFANVRLRHLHQLNHAMVSKRFIGSCCGKSRQFYFHNDARTAKTVRTALQISIQQCFELMRKMQDQSDDFRATGGLHNAALCTAGDLLLARADIGRHNALDKIYGHMLRYRLPARDKLIAFSGRVSSEVALKAAKIGVGILLSKSAPTDLALRLADDLGITVVGFIRKEQLTVYTHPKRIQAD